MRVFITSGRTITQGRELYRKDTPAYSRETSRCFIHPFDLLEIGAEEGDSLLLSTVAGEEVFSATPSEDLVPGTIFIPCGPHANAILHADTHGTGAPDYKWLEGTLARADMPPRSGWEVLGEQGGASCPQVPEPGGDESGSTTFRDVVCPLCGCLCDDLVVQVRGVSSHRWTTPAPLGQRSSSQEAAFVPP